MWEQIYISSNLLICDMEKERQAYSLLIDVGTNGKPCWGGWAGCWPVPEHDAPGLLPLNRAQFCPAEWQASKALFCLPLRGWEEGI